MMRRLGINCALLIVVVTTGIFGLEFGSRVLFPSYDPSGQVTFIDGQGNRPNLGAANTRLRQRNNSGDYDVFIEFNRHGLRDHQDIETGTAADYYVVGDSFSFGWGVKESERYSNVLAQTIGSKVFNIATPGDFNNYEKLLGLAQTAGADVQNVIVGVCMENDLRDYGLDPSAPRTERPMTAIFDLTTVKKFLASRSTLYNVLSSAVHASSTIRNAAIQAGLIVDVADSVGTRAYDAKVIASSVARLSELVANFKATLLIIPSRGLWSGASQRQEKEIHEAFVGQLVARGLDVVDLRGAFEASNQPMRYHFKNDGHWNAEGHRLAAAELAAHLARD